MNPNLLPNDLVSANPAALPSHTYIYTICAINLSSRSSTGSMQPAADRAGFSRPVSRCVSHCASTFRLLTAQLRHNLTLFTSDNNSLTVVGTEASQSEGLEPDWTNIPAGASLAARTGPASSSSAFLTCHSIPFGLSTPPAHQTEERV